MSRAAVLISGQMRSFAQCVQNQHWYLYRQLRDAAFFVACSNDAQAPAAEYLREFAADVIVSRSDDQTFPEPSVELAQHASYGPTIDANPALLAQSIMRQLWSRQHVWQLFVKYESQLAGEFDTFVRLRPDTFFQSVDLPADVRDSRLPSDRAYLPWKARCGGVNDRFAIMGRRAAEAYASLFTTIGGLLDRGAPLHGETLLAAHLDDCGIDVRNTLRVEFTTIRLTNERAHVQLIEYPGELANFIHSTLTHPD